jgi:UPF0755 protein
MKLLITLFVYALTLGSLALAGGAGWFYYEFHKPSSNEEPALLHVETGSSLSRISAQLQQAGLIEGEYAPLILKAAAKLEGTGYSLKAGEYEIPPHTSMASIMELLHEGKTFQRFVTIPEGLTSFEIVRLLNDTQNLTGKITATPPEGSLLPDSYSFHKNESRAAILARMSTSMTKLHDELAASAVMPSSVVSLCNLKDETTLTDTCWHKIITLASIVEKETGQPEERAAVAGVFLNRLERGIALQTDPTVIYAITKGEHKNGGKGPLGRRLLRKDLEFDSPYNTYRYPGLPPGPIANPGKASIEAVFAPEKHDYIYFVADGTGGHAFAKTLAEHNKNVAKWRKIRRASGK